MSEKLYGAKCHKCGCLRHDGEHTTEPIPWLRKPTEQLMWCADCDRCQENALHYMIADAGLDLFGPETRAAVKAFQRGEDHPALDDLRTTCQALEATMTLGDEVWRVVDSDLHTDDATGSKHLHLTLTKASHAARGDQA